MDLALADLADIDSDMPQLRIAVRSEGDLVLCEASGPLAEGLRELDVAERMRLAEHSMGRPALVVESQRGDYVVLTDQVIDLDRYVPLGPADAEMLSHSFVRARFGKRDDDVLTLTPWTEDDEIVVFEMDAPEFADVPVVSRSSDGSLSWHRGGVDDAVMEVMEQALSRIAGDPDTRFGVLTNAFGECLCIAEGTPLLPHEDIRRQTLIATESLLEGAETLGAAAARLHGIAERLERAASQGWELAHPIVDGIAFAEMPHSRE